MTRGGRGGSHRRVKPLPHRESHRVVGVETVVGVVARPRADARLVGVGACGVIRHAARDPHDALLARTLAHELHQPDLLLHPTAPWAEVRTSGPEHGHGSLTFGEKYADRIIYVFVLQIP